MPLREVRCLTCNKLLGKIKGEAEIEIKCPRCGTVNVMKIVECHQSAG